MANNWNIAIDGADWMRDKEKRLTNEEARPQVKQASDLMGPGLGPFAIRLQDWSSAEAVFNGVFYSLPGALNAPDGVNYFTGTVIANADGYGIQKVREYRSAPQPQREWIREFAPSVSGTVFGSWSQTSPLILFNSGVEENITLTNLAGFVTITVPHGCTGTPNVVGTMFTTTSSADYIVHTHSVDATDVSLLIQRADGTALTGQVRSVMWVAVVAH